MAIDGRRLVDPPSRPDERDPYESVGIRIVAALIVLVPAMALLVVSYLVGVWQFGETFGDVLGGLAGVVSTLLTFGLLWVWRKRRAR